MNLRNSRTRFLCAVVTATCVTTLAHSAGNDSRWQRRPSLTCTTSAENVPPLSPIAASIVGFEYVQIKSETIERAIDRNVEIAYNANKHARLSSRAPGVVAEVLVDLGQAVHKGDALAVVDSAELGSTKSDLLLAIETANLWQTTAARKRSLVDQGIGLEREALEAETKAAESRIEVNRTRQRLRTLGLNATHIEAVEKANDTSSLLTIAAPFDGLVIERSAVMGEVVESDRTLLAITDIGVMWAMVDLLETDMGFVRTGQPASVTVDGLPNEKFPGRVTWISTQIDPTTRALKARIELDNGGGLLRANMFGKARIIAGDAQSSVTVPKQAVQWEGCCNIAFVKTDDSGTNFRPARLTLGFDAGDRYVVVDGLKAGETVVTTGSFILKNQILKSAVGAGCCEVGHLE